MLTRPSLVDWYVGRLEERILAEYRDQTAPDSALPRDADETAARFLFAYMGDCDLRLRWRAAHAVRRLARAGEGATLAALVAEYDRREERAFRGGGFAFYWLAARLWFVLAWDRVAGERAELAALAGPKLLEIALDDSLPHLLVRAFARDACEKLAAAGLLSLTPGESSQLTRVNETPVPRVPADPKVRNTIGGLGHWHGFAYDHDERRFWFDATRAKPAVDSMGEFEAEDIISEETGVDVAKAEPTHSDRANSFWSSLSLTELAEAQGVVPVEDLEGMSALWPADDNPDDVLAHVLAERAARRQAARSNPDR